MTTSDFRIIQADCLEWCSGAEESFDAIVMDPPYCSGGVSEASRTSAKAQGKRTETRKKNRFKWFVGDNMGTAGLLWTIRHLARLAVDGLVRETGHFLCFCDWRQVPNLVPAIESAGLRYQNLVVWDKKSIGLGIGFRTRHECILHFSLGQPAYYSASFGNVLSVPRVKRAIQQHQTEKPVELMKNLIEVTVPRLGKVLDPFCGSGSTGEAALRSGRRFVGIDVNPEFCETARVRLESCCEE